MSHQTVICTSTGSVGGTIAAFITKEMATALLTTVICTSAAFLVTELLKWIKSRLTKK